MDRFGGAGARAVEMPPLFRSSRDGLCKLWVQPHVEWCPHPAVVGLALSHVFFPACISLDGVLRVCTPGLRDPGGRMRCLSHTAGVLEEYSVVPDAPHLASATLTL